MKNQKLQFKIQNVGFFTITIVFILLFFAGSKANAARLDIDSPTKELGLNQQFQIDVFLNTEDEEINALEGNLAFPNELVDLKEIRNGNSIINFWIDPVRNCVSNGVEKPDSICFSGIIPGGYKTAKGFIFSAVFTAKKEGEGQMTIEKARALKNDGLGTEAKLTRKNLEFRIQDLGEEQTLYPKSYILNPEKDIIPPESFKPEIAQGPDIYEGQYFLVFATQDKGTGMASYEVRDGLWGKFVAAESPYLLPNQKLNKKIIVKAVDNAGNERREVIYPPNWSPWYENYRIIAIIALGIILAYFIIKTLWRKFIK